MLALLIAVIFGLAVGYFATQNITPVTIRVSEYAIEEVPLYVVIVGSMLVGLLIAWILYLARSLSSTITIYGKDSEVKKARHAAADLEHRVQELEIENARLKTKSSSPFDEPPS
jgi:uncharacterized integral membrane protein